MGTLNARNLTQALSQARNIGLVEESFVIQGTSVVVRNLRPDQYDSIFKECQNLSEIEYLNAWQIGHVCRAICEINGMDFRDVTSVEEEEPDPKRPSQTRTIRVELHTWLLKNILSSWSREAIYICYRKVADAIEMSEKRAQEGVTFKLQDETAEDKYRRLMGELRDIEGEVPPKVLDGILRDNGLVRRSTVDEMEAVDAKLANVKEQLEEQAPQPVAETPVAAPAREQPITVERPVEEPAPKAPMPPSAERMAQLLRNRAQPNQPVNPVVASSPVQEPPQEPVRSPSGPPDMPVAAPSGRTAELAALEGMGMETPSGPTHLQPQGQEVVLGNLQRLNSDAVRGILDTPPTGGLNPRFRPPTL